MKTVSALAAMLEATLHRDVLYARAGLLRNYDPLVQEENALDAFLIRLRQTAPVDAAAARLIGSLAAPLTWQEDLVEQFNSDNALLQNSLAYIGLFTGRLDPSEASGAVAPAVSGFAVAMLRLTLDTSPGTVQDVPDRLDDLGVNNLRDKPAGTLRNHSCKAQWKSG